jgi:hypothetical protein
MMPISAIRTKAAAFCQKVSMKISEEHLRHGDESIDLLATPSDLMSYHSEVRLELARILASEFFNGSKRSQAFLRYIVEAVCIETADELKERTIGIAIFGRAPDYDTGTDAIVRVKASEIRRRLAQYNLSAPPDRPITIELRPGSYIPQITRQLVPKTIPVATLISSDSAAKLVQRRFFFATAALALLLCMVAVIHRATSQLSPIAKFWGPYIHRGQPIICTAFPSVYTRVPEQMKDVSDTHTAYLIKDELNYFGRSSRVALADDVAASDIRNSPVVLIGGPRTNRWTMSMTKDLKFSFETVENKRRIVDRDNPARFWESRAASPNGAPQEDYVIITRLVNSPAGPGAICIAGIGVYGSQAGGRFLTNAATVQSALRSAPEDWENKNLQLVLKTKVIDGVPRAPSLVASTYW